jgi:Secretion system C-terminal sorting domain
MISLKKLCTLFLGIQLAIRSYGQLPEGSIAPNFSMQTFVDQTQFDLYQLLDAGKPVIIDVSATWCSPCWIYHNTHALRNLYNIHGPLGDDKLRVVLIEGDPNTLPACLLGPTQNGCSTSKGNWTLGTAYPIIDDTDGAISDRLNVPYFPTIYTVCPDRTIRETGQISASAHWIEAQKCKVAKTGLDAGIASFRIGTSIQQICDTVLASPSFYMINYGSEALRSATIRMKYNGQILDSLNWLGDLSTYGNVPVAFNPTTITDIGTLEVSISNINGGGIDLDMTDNVKTNDFTVAPEADFHQIIVKVKTDLFGAETYWELRNNKGNVIAFGGNDAVGPNGGGLYTNNLPISPNQYQNSTIYTEIIDVPASDCYLLHTVDAFGDGICCAKGVGYIQVYDGDDLINPLVYIHSFTNTAQRVIGVSASASDIETMSAVDQMKLYPNPASSSVHLEFNLLAQAEIGIRIANTLGQIVTDFAPATMSSGNHEIAISLSHLMNGLYQISLITSDGIENIGFVVSKGR